MFSKFRTLSFLKECKHVGFCLAMCAALGTVFGVFFAATMGDSYIQLMRTAVARPVSIAGSLVAVCVPYLISFLVISMSRPGLIYMVCTVRFIVFASVAWGISQAYGTAGWLIRLLFQFPDILLMPAFVFISVACIRKRPSKKAILIFGIYTLFIGMINYCTVSPFLAVLIDTYETMGRYAFHVGLNWRL